MIPLFCFSPFHRILALLLTGLVAEAWLGWSVWVLKHGSRVRAFEEAFVSVAFRHSFRD